MSYSMFNRHVFKNFMRHDASVRCVGIIQCQSSMSLTVEYDHTSVTRLWASEYIILLSSDI